MSVGHLPRLGKAGRDDDDDVVNGTVVMLQTLHTNEVLPRVEAEMDKINRGGSLPPGVHAVPYYDQRIQNDNTFGFGINLPIRIFDRNQGEIARTKAEVQRSSAVSRAVGMQALAEVDTAWSVATTERERVRRLREIYLPKARQARDTVEFAYRRDGLSLLDFLDTQRAYRETALSEIQAVGNYEGALNQLESAVRASLDEPSLRASLEPWRGTRPKRTSDMVLLIIAAGLVVVIGTYVLSALR